MKYTSKNSSESRVIVSINIQEIHLWNYNRLEALSWMVRLIMRDVEPTGWQEFPLLVDGKPLRAHFVQILILTNHQNGSSSFIIR